jgi:hypothetical protein
MTTPRDEDARQAVTTGVIAVRASEITRLRERVRELGDEHARHALAVEAHKARADQQESRAIAAEEQLARFADLIARYEELAQQAADGQRDSDVLAEVRRRMVHLERDRERILEIRRITRSWAATPPADEDRVTLSSAGRTILAIIDGDPARAGSPS